MAARRSGSLLFWWVDGVAWSAYTDTLCAGGGCGNLWSSAPRRKLGRSRESEGCCSGRMSLSLMPPHCLSGKVQAFPQADQSSSPIFLPPPSSSHSPPGPSAQIHWTMFSRRYGYSIGFHTPGPSPLLFLPSGMIFLGAMPGDLLKSRSGQTSALGSLFWALLIVPGTLLCAHPFQSPPREEGCSIHRLIWKSRLFCFRWTPNPQDMA